MSKKNSKSKSLSVYFHEDDFDLNSRIDELKEVSPTYKNRSRSGIALMILQEHIEKELAKARSEHVMTVEE